MTRKQLQPDKNGFLRTCALFIAPVLFCFPFLFYSPITYNYTALLNDSGKVIIFLPVLPAIVILFLLLYRNRNYMIPHRLYYAGIAAAFLLLLGAILLPYHESEDFLSGMHVLLGFLFLFVLNLLVIADLLYERKLFQYYLMSLIPAAFVTFSFSSVNGLAECLHASAITILLGMHLPSE